MIGRHRILSWCALAALAGAIVLPVMAHDADEVRSAANRVPVTDLSGAKGDAALFRITVPPGATDLVFTVFGKNGAEDVDLYARYKTEPTQKEFDERDASRNPAKMVAVRAPRAGVYYALLRAAHGGYRDLSFEASYAPRGEVFKTGMHAHRLYNGGGSPEPAFRFGVIRDWDISKLHDAAIWKPGGAIDFDRVDGVYDRYAQRGTKVIKTFGSVPTWASRRPDEPNKQYPSWPGGKSGPASLDAYEDYVYRFVSHEKRALWAVEGWNEPYGCTPERSEFTTMTPTELADVQKRVYRATKRVSSRILVLSPAQAYVCGIPQLLKARTSQNEPIWKFFDALAWHPYNRSARGNAGPSYAGEVAQVRRYLAQAGLPNMPIADTEHGWLEAPKEGGREFYDMDDAQKGQVLYDTALMAKSLGVLTVGWYGYDNSMIGKPMSSPAISRRLQQTYDDFNTP